MAKLKKYDDTKKTKILSGTIPSGYKSGDSENELMVVEPLLKHPEIDGLYRAVDPQSGWRGWVEYAGDTSTDAEIDQKTIDFRAKLRELQSKRQYLELGLIEQVDFDALKIEVIRLGKLAGEI